MAAKKRRAHPDDVARRKYVRSQRGKAARREGDHFARLHAALGEPEGAVKVPQASLDACPDEQLRRLWAADGWASYAGLVWTMEPGECAALTRWPGAPAGKTIARSALGDVFVLHGGAVFLLDARDRCVRGPFGDPWLFFNSTLVEWNFRRTLLDEALVARLRARLGPLAHDTCYALRARGASSNPAHFELAPLQRFWTAR